MASWAEDQERGRRYDELLDQEPGFRPDPKPVGRVKADLKGWEAMYDLVAHAGCQVCGKLGNRSLHHIVPKSQGGDDVPENLAVLCGHGTVGCHGDVEARRNKARERLRLNMTGDQLNYVYEKKGYEWINRHYPLPLARDAANLSATEGMGSSDA